MRRQSARAARSARGAESLANPPPGLHRPGAAGCLRLLGVPEEEIQRLAQERTPATKLLLRSPVTGTVLERGVTEGRFVGADTPLFSVADLSRVWVLADVYEMNLARVEVGERARFTADAFPDRTFEGRVA